MEQEITMEKELLNRNFYRQIKSMDKMHSQIGAIKGIGETRLNQIIDIISEHLNMKKDD